MTDTVTCYEWDRIIGLSDDQRKALEIWKNKYNKDNQGDEDADSIITFGYDYVTFTKYVGIIAFKDGLVIEILPKLFRSNSDRTVNIQNYKESIKDKNKEYAKALLLTMLRACKQINYKFFQKAKLDTVRMPLLEIFIKMFIDEVNELIRRGIRCGYKTIECNGPIFKGKLILSQHIRHNAAHQERCYVQYDEFNVNRLENRLIKATCEFLVRISRNNHNRMALKKILDLLDDIEASVDFKSDISMYTRDRNLTEYDNIMIWCRMFMEHRSFSNYKGSSIAFALMYPMEKVYEGYIAKCLQNAFPDYEVKTQDQKYHLLQTTISDNDKKNLFSLRPDIILTDKSGNYWILDTKWKILNNNLNQNYGISQSDMYQMYAYYHRYQSQENNQDNNKKYAQ